MIRLAIIILIAVISCICQANEVGFKLVGDLTEYGFAKAEIVQFCSYNRLLITTNAAGENIDFYNVQSLEPVKLVKMDKSIATDGEVTSIAVAANKPYLLAAVKDKLAPNQSNGKLLVISLSANNIGGILASQSTGICPDCVGVSPDGRWAVAANEAEFDDNTEGFISVYSLDEIDYRIHSALPLVHYRIKNLDNLINTDKGKIEPEYVCFDPKSRFAAVSCQENSAIIFIDLRQDKPTLAGSIELPQGANPDGIAMIDGISTEDGINGIILGIAEEGDVENNQSQAGQSISFYWINPDNLDSGAILLYRDKIGNIIQAENSQRYDPENITMFHYCKKVFAAVAVERLDSVLILDITDPIAPKTAQTIKTGKRPEGIISLDFNGNKFIITANEGKKTYPISVISIY